jgi:hypothetical protein
MDVQEAFVLLIATNSVHICTFTHVQVQQEPHINHILTNKVKNASETWVY